MQEPGRCHGHPMAGASPVPPGLWVSQLSPQGAGASPDPPAWPRALGGPQLPGVPLLSLFLPSPVLYPGPFKPLSLRGCLVPEGGPDLLPVSPQLCPAPTAPSVCQTECHSSRVWPCAGSTLCSPSPRTGLDARSSMGGTPSLALPWPGPLHPLICTPWRPGTPSSCAQGHALGGPQSPLACALDAAELETRCPKALGSGGADRTEPGWGAGGVLRGTLLPSQLCLVLEEPRGDVVVLAWCTLSCANTCPDTRVHAWMGACTGCRDAPSSPEFMGGSVGSCPSCLLTCMGWDNSDHLSRIGKRLERARRWVCGWLCRSQPHPSMFQVLGQVALYSRKLCDTPAKCKTEGFILR